jgi:hypothetical protein
VEHSARSAVARLCVCRGLLAALLSCAGVTTAAAQVVISEIMYHPPSAAEGDEFVELHNPGPTVVNLSGWCFEGIQFCFEVADAIDAGGYLVLAPAGGTFEATYGFPPFREYALGALENNGERIALIDDGFSVVDEVTFDDVAPWPVTPDGLGPSLELIDPTEDNDTPRNWHAAVAPAGHTAGAPNSVAHSTPRAWTSATSSAPTARRSR